MSVDVELVPLPFAVVECSSEERGFEASNLEALALIEFEEDSDGWQTKRADEVVPHRLVLKVEHEDERRIVHAIEVLCHESKICEKVEISLGVGEGDVPSSFDECNTIDQLGYITLASNEGSGFESARELKSVPIERPADFIQLVLQGCHRNPLNVHNQVGLVGVHVLGVPAAKSNELTLDEGAVDVVGKTSENCPPLVNASPANTVRSLGASAPLEKIEISLAPVSSLPPNVKRELDTLTRNAVDRLERMKKEKASVEDFDAAGRIKEALGNVYALLVGYKEAEREMRQAAEAEDYALASRLKCDRDLKREAATQTLSEVEKRFVDRMDDLSISTIKDESFTSPKSKRSSLSPKKAFLETSTVASRPESEDASDEESRNNSSSVEGQGGEHPLSGVENAEELPAPEGLSDSGAASSDLVHKIEDAFGNYITKCFFSKNWMLREASLSKMTLLIPQICNDTDADKCAEVMCSIVEVAVEDRNVQVSSSSLILLDESMLQLEASGSPPNKVTPLVSRIVLNLLGKLADSKPKVADSAELALLSLASSPCIDKASIINAATKRIRSKESKGGRTVKARLQFLEKIIVEFGSEVAWKRVLDFAMGQKAFEHKDGGVRDASKELVVTLMLIHGEETVTKELQDLTERLRNEFHSRLVMAKQR